MKNLRKVLAVVLVVCMALSFAAVASAKNLADYADASTVTNKVAVDVMAATGLMTGDGGTNWNPTGTFTREQAAKVVASMLSAYAGQFTVTASSFSDVATTRWSSPYIEYCAAKGIIGGYGDGKFGPADPVTSAQFSVMLLKALGYGKNNEFAANWEVYAIEQGLALGILTGTGSFSVPATREQVAQYAFNALNLTMKVWNKNLEQYENAAAPNTFAAKLGLMTATGIVTANASTGVAGTNINTFTVVGGVITDIANAATNYSIATTSDMIGQVVMIYYKTAATALAVSQLSTTKTVATATTSAATYAAALGTANDSAAVLNFTANFAATTEDAALAGFTFGTIAPAGRYALYNGELVSYVAPATYTIQKVTAYTAPTATALGSVQLTGVTAAGILGATAAMPIQMIGSTTPNVATLYAGIAVGDYVYVDILGTAGVHATTVTKATTAVGTCTAFATTSATINGASAAISAVVDGTGLTDVVVGTVGTTQRNFVFDKTGAVAGYAAVPTVSTADTYGVVLATSYTGAVAPALGNGFVGTYGYATIYILKADGTKVVYKWTNSADTAYAANAAAVELAFDIAFGLDANSNSTVDAGESLVVKNVLKFAATSAMALTACERQAATAGATIVAGSALSNVASTYYTASTVFVYMNTAAVTNAASVVTGYANAQAAAATHVTLVAANGFVVFAFVDEAYALAPTTENVAYFRSNTYSVAQYDTTLAATIYGYTAYVNGVATTLWSTNNALAPAVGEFSKYTLTAGMLTAVANPTGTEFASQTIAFKDASAIIYGAVQLTYASANVITYSASANTVTAGGTFAVGSVISGVYSATNVLLYVVVEVA